jgi:hypothetical protein
MCVYLTGWDTFSVGTTSVGLVSLVIVKLRIALTPWSFIPRISCVAGTQQYGVQAKDSENERV